MAKVGLTSTKLARVPGAPYSAGIKRGNLVFVSGMVALDASGKLVGEGDVTRQTEQTMENMKAVLEAAGATMDDVTSATVYLTDGSNFAAMNGVYRQYFSDPFPSRATLVTGLVVPGALVEISAIAVLEG